jgi:hypothetical protein
MGHRVWSCNVGQDRQPAQPGNNLTQKFDPLARNVDALG